MNGFICSKEALNYAVYFRKELEIKKGEKVIVSLSAIGLVKAYINSLPFDCDLLTPGWTNYNVRIPYYDFDITDKVREGNNCLSFVVGNGWACGKVAWFGKNKYADKPYMWCKIAISNGSDTRVIYSDESFQYENGEIRDNDVFDGEVVDATYLKKEFNSIGYKSKSLQNAIVVDKYTIRLEKAIAPLTKPIATLKGLLLTSDGNKYLYDFSQNHSGIISFNVKNAVKGSKIMVRFGEMLNDDGSLYVENLRSAKCTDYFIVGDENERNFSTLFTYHGYRYAEFTVDGECEIANIESKFISAFIKNTGEFSCSDENVNKLYKNVKMGQASNFVSVPTDCPQRDERLGWTGDAQIFCKSAMYNSDCREFFKKYLADIRDAQTLDGMIDCVAPSVSVDFDHHRGAPAWGDVITVLPYEYYCVYKDKSVITVNLSSAKKWVRFCLSQSIDYVRPACGYGDWLSIDDTSDNGVLANLYMGYSSYLVSRMCHIVGDEEESLFFDIFNKVKMAFINKYVDERGIIFSDTQTVYLLAYNFGFLDGKDILPHLLRTIKRRNNHLSTGFVGVKYLLPTLCNLGESDLAYELLTKTDYPSWCYSVVNGATTIWERWNSYSVTDGFASRTMNSFNHYSLGSVAEWIYGYALGIRFNEERCFIKPIIDFSGKINSVRGSYSDGDIDVEIKWNVDGNIAKLLINKNKDFCVILDDYVVLDYKENIYTLMGKNK